MPKMKYLIAGCVVVCLAALLTLTYVIWRRNTDSRIQQRQVSAAADSTRQVLSQSSSGETSGLQVASGSTADSLGQIPNSSGSQNNSNASSSSSTNSSTPKQLDPSTFKQYDAFKTE